MGYVFMRSRVLVCIITVYIHNLMRAYDAENVLNEVRRVFGVRAFDERAAGWRADHFF